MVIKKVSKKKLTRKREKKQKHFKKFNKIGGGLFNKNTSIGLIIKNTKKSENALIKNYQEYVKTSEKYYNSYEKHIDNLKDFDSFIPNVKSFTKIFTDKLMPNDILSNTKIDKSVPLLVGMYDIDSSSSPKEITISHIRQQINYAFFKYYKPHERHLIKDIYITLNEDPTKDIILKVSLINDRVADNRRLGHTNYLVDQNTLSLLIDDMLLMAKENVEDSKTSPALAKPSRRERRILQIGNEEEEGKAVIPGSIDMSNTEKIRRGQDGQLDDMGRRENDLLNIIDDFNGDLPDKPNDFGEPDDLNSNNAYNKLLRKNSSKKKSKKKSNK